MDNNNVRGITVWLTGLPCSGKSTIANSLADLINEQRLRVQILDGDELRENICQGLGFSRKDRDENIRRIAYVAKLLTQNGIITIAAAISPFRETRLNARTLIGNFVEVYVKCPLEVCIERDVKGMYKKALSGEISNFTGVSDPYEEPDNPELVIETNKVTPQEAATEIYNKIKTLI